MDNIICPSCGREHPENLYLILQNYPNVRFQDIFCNCECGVRYAIKGRICYTIEIVEG